MAKVIENTNDSGPTESIFISSSCQMSESTCLAGADGYSFTPGGPQPEVTYTNNGTSTETVYIWIDSSSEPWSWDPPYEFGYHFEITTP